MPRRARALPPRLPPRLRRDPSALQLHRLHPEDSAGTRQSRPPGRRRLLQLLGQGTGKCFEFLGESFDERFSKRSDDDDDDDDGKRKEKTIDNRVYLSRRRPRQEARWRRSSQHGSSSIGLVAGLPIPRWRRRCRRGRGRIINNVVIVECHRCKVSSLFFLLSSRKKKGGKTLKKKFQVKFLYNTGKAFWTRYKWKTVCGGRGVGEFYSQTSPPALPFPPSKHLKRTRSRAYYILSDGRVV